MPVNTIQRVQAGAQPFSNPLSLPAPVNGWNSRDELDAMDPLDAVQLDNFFPDYSGITARKGYVEHATGLGGSAVETLAEFRAGATARLLGACDGSIYNVTSPGVVGPAIGSGFTNDRWQWTNFLSRLFLANGADTMQVYDGTTLGDAGFTGVTLSTLVGMVQYQQRLFFWPNNSPGFWYAPLNSITGELKFFDLSPFCPRGANLVNAGTITHDGGNGVLDFIAFIMSSGDMILYYGNDPGSASAWQMVGRYRVAPPVNIRSIASYGADTFVTTFDDHLPIQEQLVALKVGAMPPRSKISGAVQQAMIAGRNLFGWQALYYPKGRYLIFNVPTSATTFDQHICNTSLPTKPWCRFQNIPARCWSLLNDGLFFGSAGGVVCQADVSFLDNDEPISCTAQQAWNKVDTAQTKRMTAVRPIVQSTQGSYTFVVGFDYQTLNIPTPVGLDGAVLVDDSGTPITDEDDNPITLGVQGITVQWHASGGVGTAFGFGMQVLSAAQTSWLRTDFRLEPGFAL